MRINVIINKEFDRFIDQQSFTQKNLGRFEIDLRRKLNEVLQSEGMSLANPPKGYEQFMNMVPQTARIKTD